MLNRRSSPTSLDAERVSFDRLTLLIVPTKCPYPSKNLDIDRPTNAFSCSSTRCVWVGSDAVSILYRTKNIEIDGEKVTTPQRPCFRDDHLERGPLDRSSTSNHLSHLIASSASRLKISQKSRVEQQVRQEKHPLNELSVKQSIETNRRDIMSKRVEPASRTEESKGRCAERLCQGNCTVSKNKKRKLCEMGTGEIVHILSYSALPGKIDEFEEATQSIANCLYKFKTGITDVRVCHPCVGQVCFVLTFLSRQDLEKFRSGPQAIAESKMYRLSSKKCAKQDFSATGCLMPACHTLCSLLHFLKTNVVGECHRNHDVRHISRAVAQWYPRESEYLKYVHWNKENPKQYTRNLIFHNDNMDVILMCWPPHSKSSIHDHDESSCWVVVVEGEAHEVQYGMPQVDRKFIESEMKSPSGARGRCGPLKVSSEYKLHTAGVTSTYANNEIGLHRVENRSDLPAYTLHVYAPPLKKMKIYCEKTNEVHVHVVKSTAFTSIEGKLQEGALDIEGWNTNQCCRNLHLTPPPSP